MKATDGSGLRKRQSGFAAVPNATAQDTQLSARARGVLLLVVSLPEDWDLRMDWLVEQFPEGRDAISTAVRELRKHGYYRVERRRRDSGTFTTGISVSDVRLPEWVEQHAAAVAAQGTDKPKWDVSLRVLADGSVEDEPRPGQHLPPVSTEGDDPATGTDDGFPGTGTANGFPVSGSPVTGEPVTGPPDVKERHTTKTQPTQAEGVTPVSRGASTQPPSQHHSIKEDDSSDELDAQGLPPRYCPDHRVRPAQGPCTPCGRYRRTYEIAVEEQLAAERGQAAAAERSRLAESRHLADAEVGSCALCDAAGTASVTVPGVTDKQGKDKPITLICLHDADRNQRAVELRCQARASLAARPRRSA